MLIVTINEVPGKKLEALGVVRGSTVQSRNLGHDLMAGFRTLVGGEVTDYADMLTEARQIATKVAALTDLGPLLDTRARNLTVGGMKRLEMARALATRPRVLLLEEVMAGLNPTDVGKAIEIIRRVRDTGVSVLMIEHIMQATMTLSDRIVVISTGAVLMDGEPQAVVTNPQVIEAYLGKEYDHAAA